MDRIYKTDNEKLEYVSVTTALSVLDKPGLYRWYGLNGIEKCEEIMKDSIDFGKAIHSKLELSFKTGRPVNVDAAPDHQKLVLAKFNQWRDDVDFEYIESELTVYSDRFLFAGTLDVYGRVNGEPHFIDFKTGNYIYDTVAYQLSAVKEAYIETYPADREAIGAARSVLHLNRKDPMYRFKTFKEDNRYQDHEASYSAFLSCLNLYKIRRKLNLDLGIKPNDIQYVMGALSEHEKQEANAAVSVEAQTA